MSRPPYWLVKVSIALGVLPLVVNLGFRAQMALGLYPPYPSSLGVVVVELLVLKLIDPFFLVGVGTPIAGGSVWPWILMTPAKILFWLGILWFVYSRDRSQQALRSNARPAH